MQSTLSTVFSNFSESRRYADLSVAMVEEFADRPDAILPILELGALKSRPGRNEPIGRKLLHMGLANAEKHGDQWGIGHANICMGWSAQNLGQFERAREHFERALAIFETLRQPSGIANAKFGLEEYYHTLGDVNRSYDLVLSTLPYIELLDNQVLLITLKNNLARYKNSQHWEEEVANSLELSRQIGDKRQVSWTLYNLGWSTAVNEHYDRAKRYLTEALPIFHDLGDIEGESWSQIYLGVIELAQDNPTLARQYGEGALQVVAHTDFPWVNAGVAYLFGDIALYQHRWEQARQQYHAAVMIAHHAQSVLQILRHLAGFVELMIHDEDYEAALKLATYIRKQPPAAQDTRLRIDKLLAHLHQHFAPDVIEAAQTEIETWTLDDVVQRVLGHPATS